MTQATSHPEIVALLSANPATASAMAHLEAGRHSAHIVGGAVRDALLGREVADIDIATSAHPETVTEIFRTAGHSVHPTGIDHGTVTVVVDEVPIEITTWRRDVATDGRRATIAFAETLAADSERRDFTINALYADRSGRIADPTGRGLTDIADGRVRFVGEPETRIREDALRILRFYRFQSVLGLTPDRRLASADPGDAACRALADLVATLPRERIGVEVLKLLKGENAPDAVGAMITAGVMDRAMPDLGVTADMAAAILSRAAAGEATLGLAPDALRRLVALAAAPEHCDLRLSRKTSRHISDVIDAADGGAGPAELGYRHGVEVATDAVIRRAARTAIALPGPAEAAEIDRGARQVFPWRAGDLDPDLAGPEIGRELRRLEAEWIARDFTT